MAQACWQCGASPEPAIASESGSPDSRPLRDFHRLLTSNDVPLDSEIPFIHNIASDGQKQIDALEAAIAQLARKRGKAAIAQLTRKRDEMVENIRQHRAILSPIRRVPPELVCEILVLSLSSDDDGDIANEPPWHLGHICRFWRHCVLAYPALWSSITIPSSSSPSDPHPLLSMLAIQLVRSADAPLRICWSPCDDRNTADPGSVDLVLAHSSRWRTLLLDICCKFDVLVSLDWLRPANGRLLALETFKVTCNRGRVEIPDIFSTTPSLRNVFLTNWTFEVCTSVPAIPWAQITRYSGTFDPDSQTEILEAAANLVSCALGFPNWNAVDRDIPTVLPRLRRIHLETPEFFHRIEAPLLEELICDTCMDGVPEILPFVHVGKSQFD
ncbi:hypothetical protein B0H14DRAFT_166839 [Mycena olivaceomarginata]|nr:hypothetical protein B0H14DRAFT_166839 [Mycena olivaceomarginata]